MNQLSKCTFFIPLLFLSCCSSEERKISFDHGKYLAYYKNGSNGEFEITLLTEGIVEESILNPKLEQAHSKLCKGTQYEILFKSGVDLLITEGRHGGSTSFMESKIKCLNKT